MDLIDFALPVGWLLVGAGAMLLVQRLVRDRGVERLSEAIERQQSVIEARVDEVLAGAEQRILAHLREHDRDGLAAIESRLTTITAACSPQPLDDDAGARLHARRRRVVPDLFSAIRDLHRSVGDLVDELQGWPEEVDPPNLWEAVDVARARLHATFTRSRIHLPTPLDTLVAEYRRVVAECLASQRAGEQLEQTRPQAARFSIERARSLLRAADEHFRRIEDGLRGIVEEAPDDAFESSPGDAHAAHADSTPPAGSDAQTGIRPSKPPHGLSSPPTISFSSDLLDPDDSSAPVDDRPRGSGGSSSGSSEHRRNGGRVDESGDEDDDAPSRNGGGGPSNGDPNDTLRPRD